MNRAERYKRNYRIVRNAYNDPKLARRARTWSDERLYNELGITTTVKKEPELKELSTNNSYYERKLENFTYARKLGLNVKDAKKYTKYSKERIKTTSTYKKLADKPFDYENRVSRQDKWKEWSKEKVLCFRNCHINWFHR